MFYEVNQLFGKQDIRTSNLTVMGTMCMRRILQEKSGPYHRLFYLAYEVDPDQTKQVYIYPHVNTTAIGLQILTDNP